MNDTTDSDVRIAEFADDPDEIPVYVSGEVYAPGVYYLERGSLIQDAIERAGGFRPMAAADSINLAREIKAHQQIRVPTVKEVNNPPDGWQYDPEEGLIESSSGGLININDATAEELESLPGIGPATANAIIRFREKQRFSTIEDLMLVPGIKEARFEALADHIFVD